MNKILCAVFGLICFSATAQFSEEFNNLKQKYPESQSVRLVNNVTLTIQLKRDEFEISREVIEEDLYLDESANYRSKRSLNFSSFFELEKIDASSFIFDDNKYEEFKVNDFVEKDRLDNSFHDDSKTLSYIYPNLRKGSKSKLEYTENIKNPRFLSPFFFSDFYPIVNQKFTVEVDEEIDIRFVEMNMEELDVKFTEENKWGKNIYTWETKNIPEVKSESNVPTYRKIFPHIIPIISSYQNGDKEIPVLRNTEDLYNWYLSLTENLNQDEPSDQLISITKGLTKGLTSDLEKVKAIYYWVQSNIKYIAFEYELGGFIPREANRVFDKKYGDCKDNSSILEQMLKIAGLKGHLTWVGTRSLPYRYEDVPTPLSDNHMILTYKDSDGSNYYLDATGRYLPIDYPSSFIQGKEVLIGDKNVGFQIEKVPYVEAKKNSFKDTVHAKIEENNLVGSSTAEVKGYLKIDLFHALEGVDKDDDLKSIYKGFLEKGTNKFMIDNIVEEDKFNYEDNFNISYDFSINDYVKTIGEEIYMNPHLNKDLTSLKIDDDRKFPVENDYRFHFDFTNIFEIPEGYQVDYLPKNFELENEILPVKLTYTVKDDKIICNQQFSLNYIELDLDSQKQLNKYIEQIENQYSEIIVFKKI